MNLVDKKVVFLFQLPEDSASQPQNPTTQSTTGQQSTTTTTTTSAPVSKDTTIPTQV